jgi:hypothetical protein
LPSIVLQRPAAHSPVRDAYLVEQGPFSPESQPLVEAYGVGLRVKVYLRKPQFCGLVHEMDNDGGADPAAAVTGQHRNPADLAAWSQPAGPGKFARGGERKRMSAGRVGRIHFL